MSSTQRWFLAILLIALGLRLTRLGAPSLWYDECLTAKLTSLATPAQIARGTGLDVHPPLYYLIVAYWRRVFGASEASLRFPSVIFGVATLLIWWRIGDALHLPTNVILLGVGFMAISPSLLFYSQETRMYSLLIFAVSLATLGVLQGSWPLLAIGGIIATYSHNISAVYLVSLGILALLRGWPIDKLTLACSLTSIAYMPWAYRLLFQLQTLSGGYWVPPLRVGGIFYSLYPLTFFFGLPEWAAVHGCIVAIALATLAVWKALPKYRETYPLLLLFLGPPIITAIISWTWQPMYFYRPMIAIVPPFLFLIAYMVLRIRRRNALLLALLVMPLLALSLVRQFGDKRGLRQPERDHAQVIADNWQEGDCIFHMNVGSAITQDYYLPNYPQFIWAGPAALFNGALSVETQETLKLDRREFEDLPRTCHRAWLVWWENPLTGQEEHDEAERLIAQYNGHKFHTFVSNEMVEATLWILSCKNAG